MWSEWGVVTPKWCTYMYTYMHLVHTCAYNKTPTPHPLVHIEFILQKIYLQTLCEGVGRAYTLHLCLGEQGPKVGVRAGQSK